jgi:hypothetical protein
VRPGPACGPDLPAARTCLRPDLPAARTCLRPDLPAARSRSAFGSNPPPARPRIGRRPEPACRPDLPSPNPDRPSGRARSRPASGQSGSARCPDLPVVRDRHAARICLRHGTGGPDRPAARTCLPARSGPDRRSVRTGSARTGLRPRTSINLDRIGLWIRSDFDWDRPAHADRPSIQTGLRLRVNLRLDQLRLRPTPARTRRGDGSLRIGQAGGGVRAAGRAKTVVSTARGRSRPRPRRADHADSARGVRPGAWWRGGLRELSGPARHELPSPAPSAAACLNARTRSPGR